MSYMKDLETELRAKLSGITHDAEEQDAFIKYVKALVLTSYRNGQKAGAPAAKKPQKGARPICASFGCGNPAEEDGEYCAAH